MTFVRKMLGASAAAALLIVGIVTGAQSQVPAGSGPGVGVGSRGLTQIQGKVVCVRCTIEEVQQAQPDAHHLYQLAHRQGQVVLQVSEVDDSSRWSALSWPPKLWVRARESLLQQLSSEAMLFKEVEITGLLSNTRTLDIFAVSIRG